MDENKEVKVEEKTVEEQPKPEVKEVPKENLPAVTIRDNWLDKLQRKNHDWRLERAKKKAAKEPMSKAEKGAKIGIGIGVTLTALGAVAGITLRHILNSTDSDYELDDDDVTEEDGYFNSQLNGTTAEATEEEV